jgi:hypothetical protein
MPDNLPTPLQEAMWRLLDADADSDRSPTPARRLRRIELLRAARAVVSAWREGRVTTEQAAVRIDELATSMREGER